MQWKVPSLKKGFGFVTEAPVECRGLLHFCDASLSLRFPMQIVTEAVRNLRSTACRRLLLGGRERAEANVLKGKCINDKLITY